MQFSWRRVELFLILTAGLSDLLFGFFPVLSLKGKPRVALCEGGIVRERRGEEVCQRGFQTVGFVAGG